MFDNDKKVSENALPVSAGEFQFSITFAFVANYANLIDNRPKRRLHKLEVPIKIENKVTEKKDVDVVNLRAKKMCWDMSKGTPSAGNRPQALLRRYGDVISAAPRIAVGV